MFISHYNGHELS